MPTEYVNLESIVSKLIERRGTIEKLLIENAALRAALEKFKTNGNSTDTRGLENGSMTTQDTQHILEHLHRIEHSVRHGLAVLDRKINMLINGEVRIMTQLSDALDQAEAAATANAAADDAAEALLVTIAKMLSDAVATGGTPADQIARIQAITDGLTARSAQLAAAVVANTPAAPAPTP